MLENRPIRGVVVNDEHRKATQTCRHRSKLWALDLCRRKECREPEGATPTRLTVDVDATTHQLSEPARDGQAEAGSAVSARRRAVGLREGLEEAATRFWCDA